MKDLPSILTAMLMFVFGSRFPFAESASQVDQLSFFVTSIGPGLATEPLWVGWREPTATARPLRRSSAPGTARGVRISPRINPRSMPATASGVDPGVMPMVWSLPKTLTSFTVTRTILRRRRRSTRREKSLTDAAIRRTGTIS